MQVDISEKFIRGDKIFQLPYLPPIPTKIKALMMSTVIPGSGQIWVERKYPGYGFMGTELLLGTAALFTYSQ